MNIFKYDDQNIFAKILRGEIPCNKIYETEYCLAFEDINPKAPVHVLLIPKGAYVNMDHFCEEASENEIVDFMRAVGELTRQEGLVESEGGKGHRIIVNTGPHGMQEVDHMHVHIMGGEAIGPLRSE